MQPHSSVGSTSFSIANVLLIEDEPYWHNRMLEILLQFGAELNVTSVSNLNDALEAIPKTQFDLLIVDLGLPDGSGIDAIRATRRMYPNCDILVGTLFADEVNVVNAIRAGATGYVLKESDPNMWLSAISDVRAGHSPIDPRIARHVLRAMQAGPDNKLPVAATEMIAPSFGVRLTSRETEVLKLIAKGFTLIEVSKYLNISVETVKSHAKKIYGKLEVSSRGEAIFEATQLGML